MEKCGYQHEATLKSAIHKYGQYFDEHIYALLRNDWLIKPCKNITGLKRKVHIVILILSLVTLLLLLLIMAGFGSNSFSQFYKNHFLRENR
jgi:hypothetical protein